jgi:hypothetical protein
MDESWQWLKLKAIHFSHARVLGGIKVESCLLMVTKVPY